ncbi:DUF1652 domain-containing protein [Pseudomonas sp. v388]|uniref:DUF1652 domain-containing protein n=1 Tax=Pseudomonas sp. v388 TaxID=2479849 RepID=UPI000F77ED25|nr:DUF1652 domain-containing protein [Pseudomonas sp. v388]RRV03751.1 DUF1652 domain-containing protein [Pseudomonas sp. v388]
MLSHLELRQIVESGFLPMKSVCSITSEGMMTVELFHPMKGHAAVIARDIPVEGLETSRAIATLVAQLKSQLQETQEAAGNRWMKPEARFFQP